MRGRKPKPDAVKALQGNPGKRRGRQDAAALAEGPLVPVGIAALPVPEPPPGMTGAAADEWRRLAPELVRLGLLRRVDMGAFEARCELYATWRACRLKVAAEGVTYELKGMQRVRPEVKLSQDCLRQMRQFDGEFGLTPAARARVAHVSGGAEQPRLPIPEPEQASEPKASAKELPEPMPSFGGDYWPSDEAYFANRSKH